MGMNITKISSADYVQSTVAAADGNAPAAMKGEGLTAYYTAEGNPPGQWFGRGVDALNRDVGDEITSDDAIAVWQLFRSPSTGESLGKPRRTTKQTNNQLAETTKQQSRDTAGFDLTFTVPKDVSILWALGDPRLQAEIAAAHHAALTDTLTYIEDNIAQTRAGHGGAVTLGIKGLIAGRWNHWDSRDGDPHLHTHVLLANRVQRASDGKWVTLDSRALFKNAVHASELHQNLLMDELTRRLGISWVERSSSGSRAVVPEIAGINSDIRKLFSGRHSVIAEAKDSSIARFEKRYGRVPNKAELAQLDSRAWRATRQAKSKDVGTLPEKLTAWKDRASTFGFDIPDLIAGCLNRDTTLAFTGTTDAPAIEALALLTARVLDEHTTPVKPDGEMTESDYLTALSEHVERGLTANRSTWSAANIRAEVERMTRMIRSLSPEIRMNTTDQITRAVMDRCVAITPTRYIINSNDPHISKHGRSVFDDIHRAMFTSRQTLAKEEYLLQALTSPVDRFIPDDPELLTTLMDNINTRQIDSKGFALAPDQDAAVRAILSDTTRLSVLIGPAGTGKTTTMAGLTDAWTTLHGEHTVIGMTTSAQAAHILGSELDSPAHTIAKWIHESTTGNDKRRERAHTINTQLQHLTTGKRSADQQRTIETLRRELAALHAEADAWSLHAGQLIIIDEASMTSTTHLAELIKQADEAGAKVLMVGDHRQIDAVEAGGALEFLATNGTVHHLTSVWRFRENWEADISLRLREVHDEDEANTIIAEYDSHDRLHGGEDEAILDEAYTATRDALDAGRSALIIASTNTIVDDLNQRFTHDLRISGLVDASDTVTLRQGRNAGIGDRILTRTNNRDMLDTSGDFIRNGTLLHVTKIHADGSATARREDNKATITLPADYLSTSVELGYATTAHRCQGVTVDEARIVIPSTDPIPSELLYVGLTRGRSLNSAYIGEIPEPDVPEGSMSIADEDVVTWRERLNTMMLTRGAETAATTAMRDAHEDSNTLARLSAEYEYLTTLENHEPLINDLCTTHHLTPLAVNDSIVLPSLLAAYRAARAYDPTAARDALTRPLTNVSDDVEDQLKVLTARLRALTAPPGHISDTLLPGGIPQIDGVNDEVRDLAQQVETRIHSRLRELTERATSEPWAADLPRDLINKIAVYRDLYRVRTPSPLGPPPPPRDTAHTAHWQELTDALKATSHTTAPVTTAPPASPAHPELPPATQHPVRAPRL